MTVDWVQHINHTVDSWNVAIFNRHCFLTVHAVRMLLANDSAAAAASCVCVPAAQRGSVVPPVNSIINDVAGRMPLMTNKSLTSHEDEGMPQ